MSTSSRKACLTCLLHSASMLLSRHILTKFILLVQSIPSIARLLTFSQFSPMIDRAEFVRGYQSGNCSLFLLHAILAPASLHAPADVLFSCGFADRSAAQSSFFFKAKLLHDFTMEENSLTVLQGCIILSMVILDHPTNWDLGYWLHNAVRLATKLDVRNM